MKVWNILMSFIRLEVSESLRSVFLSFSIYWVYDNDGDWHGKEDCFRFYKKTYCPFWFLPCLTSNAHSSVLFRRIVKKFWIFQARKPLHSDFPIIRRSNFWERIPPCSISFTPSKGVVVKVVGFKDFWWKVEKAFF